MLTSAEMESLDKIAKVLATQRFKGDASVTRRGEGDVCLTISKTGCGSGMRRSRVLAADNFEDARLEIAKAVDFAVAP